MNAAIAREAAAALTYLYQGMVPARLVLVCGVSATSGPGTADPGAGFGVGVHRFAGSPRPLVIGVRMFSFVGYDTLR